MVNKSALIFLIFIIFSCCPFTSYKPGPIYNVGKHYECYVDFSGQELITTIRDLIFIYPAFILPFDTTKVNNGIRDYKNISRKEFYLMNKKQQVKILLDSMGKENKKQNHYVYLKKYNLYLHIYVFNWMSKRKKIKELPFTKLILKAVSIRDLPLPLNTYGVARNCEEQDRFEQIFEKEFKTKLDSLLLVNYPDRRIE